jgi:hypothetical protein
MSYADLDILKATTCTLGGSHRAHRTWMFPPRSPLLHHHIDNILRQPTNTAYQPPYPEF